MSGTFLDSTIVVHASDQDVLSKNKCLNLIKNNQPAQAPYYALRELLSGHVNILCDTHNILLSAENAGEAFLALTKRPAIEGRKKMSKLEALSSTIKEVFAANPSGDRASIQKEMLEYLSIRINGIWKRSKNIQNVTLVHSLSCFNDGKITYGEAGELRGPNDSFMCIKKQRCAAAAYLFDNKPDIQKMIEALHPDNLDESAANKRENQQRRKALKEILSKGPKDFNKNLCRAIGDAYFVGMAPASASVATTNKKDFEPLCASLNKNLISP